MDLKSKIAFVIDTNQFLEEVGNEKLHAESLDLAAEILAIPAIAKALGRSFAGMPIVENPDVAADTIEIRQPR